MPALALNKAKRTAFINAVLFVKVELEIIVHEDF